jgi:hypothetical protein
MQRVVFSDLASSDIVLDAIYESDRSRSSYGAEPLHHLIPGFGNAGGFRKSVNKEGNSIALLLTSNGAEVEWPDELDPYSGTYTYYGDNRKPGRDLHETKPLGNLELSRIFALAHGNKDDRAKVPIILVFHSVPGGRDFQFKGLAVPGTSYLSRGEDLVAIWRVTNGERFQNYRSTFTILNIGTISGSWIREVVANKFLDLSDNRFPKPLKRWIETGRYEALTAEKDRQGRTQTEQLASPGIAESLIQTIYDEHSSDPFGFEPIAAALWKLSQFSPMEYEITRRSKDGGRDAVGFINLGPLTDPIRISFALEAKLYKPGNSVGVKEASRLISRIKHREFGVLVTTSYLDKQAYKEIREDGHPIVIISGQDIADILLKCGINTPDKVRNWMLSIVK